MTGLRRQAMTCGPCRYGPTWPCMGELTSANLDRHRDLLGLDNNQRLPRTRLAVSWSGGSRPLRPPTRAQRGIWRIDPAATVKASAATGKVALLHVRQSRSL